MSGRLMLGLVANANFRMLENSLGFALRDGHGHFFCGFRQSDGQLAFDHYRQGPDGAIARQQDREFDHEHPVFLSLEDMKAQQAGAAVFTDLYVATSLSGLSHARLNDCRYAMVAKDLTVQIPEAGALTSSMLQYSMPGLASAAACERTQDRGFVSVSKAIAEKWQAVRGFITRTLG